MFLSVCNKQGFGLEEALVIRLIIVVFIVEKTLLLLGSYSSKLLLFFIELLEFIVLAQLGVREAISNTIICSFW